MLLAVRCFGLGDGTLEFVATDNRIGMYETTSAYGRSGVTGTTCR